MGRSARLVAEQSSGFAVSPDRLLIFHYRSGGSRDLEGPQRSVLRLSSVRATTKRGDICSGAGEAAQPMDFGNSDSNDLFMLLDARHISPGKNVVTSSPHTLTVLRDARSRRERRQG